MSHTFADSLWAGSGWYLLVIYYQNVRSYGAGMLTVLSNRIGDVALLIVIAWIINFGSWSFIYYLGFLSGSFEIELISFLVVLAAMTKSAQIPFSSWLPAAIATPTPVYVLVHSSALVTAGVYLLIRFSPSFGDWLNIILLLVSGLTIFMAGLGANFEFDLRRIVSRIRMERSSILILLASCQQTCMTYTIAVCTVKNSWWWTEELSEICRVSFRE